MIARRSAWLASVAVAAGAGCGDDLRRDDDPFTPVSGSRLALQKYRYEDGTELAVGGEFYDLELHTRCTPQRWDDDAVRCVPVADDAVFRDAGCTSLIGIARTIAEPTWFVLHDAGPTGRVVTRVLDAGAPAAPITEYWESAGGACIGPTPVATGQLTFFEVGGGVAPGDQVAFHDRELGTGRLGLVIRETDDGLRVVSGIRDRELDAACTPAAQDGGSVACEPSEAAAASLYGDPACGEPVIATAAAAAPPFARLTEPSGCARYYRIGREMSPPIFRRDGDKCTPTEAPLGGRLFALAEPIMVAPLTRVREASAGRRLQRILLDLGETGLKFPDDRLFDSALGAECRPRTLRTGVRCLPANTANAPTLFLDGCTAPAAVSELPRRCEPIDFAITGRPFQIRAVGAPATAAVFELDGGGVCHTHAPAAGSELRTLGPSIDFNTFVEGIYFGERAP